MEKTCFMSKWLKKNVYVMCVGYASEESLLVQVSKLFFHVTVSVTLAASH